MIKLNFIGRLGNNMIQYAIARFLCEKKAYQLTYENIGHTSSSQMFDLFPRTRDNILGKSLLHNKLIIGYDDINNHIQECDINLLLNHNGCIELKGFFQKYNLFFDNEDLVKSYFQYDESNLKTSMEYDVVIHIRLTDYVELNHFIHPEKIYNLYKELNFLKALIITDDPNNELLDCFRNNIYCKIEKNSIIQDLHYMSTSKNIIISQSTFSWWGSYLGNEKTIYVPYTNHNYPWPHNPMFNDIDLIPNKPNYIKIKI